MKIATTTPFAVAVEILRVCIESEGKILLCGNGGSAAQAQHLAAEFIGRYKKERPGIAAIALTADSAVITALSNDYGYVSVFCRQVEALGRPGDVLMAFSTSGKSSNVLRAITVAREKKGMKVIGFSGADHMLAPCDVDLFVPSKNTPYIQERHLETIHALCEALDL